MPPKNGPKRTLPGEAGEVPLRVAQSTRAVSGPSTAFSTAPGAGPRAPAAAPADELRALPPELAGRAPADRARRAHQGPAGQVDLDLEAAGRLPLERQRIGHRLTGTGDLLDPPQPDLDRRLVARAHRLGAPAPLELEVRLGRRLLAFGIVGTAAAAAVALLLDARLVERVEPGEVALARLVGLARPARRPRLEHALEPGPRLLPQRGAVEFGRTEVVGEAVDESRTLAVLGLPEVEARPARVDQDRAQVLLRASALERERGVEGELERVVRRADLRRARVDVVEHQPLASDRPRVDLGPGHGVEAGDMAALARLLHELEADLAARCGERRPVRQGRAGRVEDEPEARAPPASRQVHRKRDVPVERRALDGRRAAGAQEVDGEGLERRALAVAGRGGRRGGGRVRRRWRGWRRRGLPARAHDGFSSGRSALCRSCSSW